MERVICRSAAKVPIVKVWDPELQLACDMNVNNSQALENTRMIKTYVQLDDRVRPLAKIIKHWTKQRILNDAGMYMPVNDFCTQLTNTKSIWRNYIILYLDMYDHKLLTNEGSSHIT